MSAGSAAAASPTTGVVPAAADEVGADRRRSSPRTRRCIRRWRRRPRRFTNSSWPPWESVQRRTRPPRPLTPPPRSKGPEVVDVGFRGATAGDQFRADVCGCGSGADVRSCGGLGFVGRGLAVHVGRLRVDDPEPDHRAVDGSVFDSDGGRGHAVCGVDQRHRGAGRAGGQPGQDRRDRLRNRRLRPWCRRR